MSEENNAPPTSEESATPSFPGKRHSLLGEFWMFIKNEKKWWLTPIVIVFIFLTFLIIVSQTPLGPFIYPLF